MTCNDIYERALAMLGELPGDEALSDYSTRADYLLPGVIAQLTSCSFALGVDPGEMTSGLEKSDDFPLDERLASAAASLLAAFLIAPEDAEEAELLSEDAGVFCKAFAADVGTTRDIYGF